MSTTGWQTKLALAPLLRKPLHFFGYFLVFLGLGIAVFLFQAFQAETRILEKRSVAALLGGDVMVDIGYRPFETVEREFIVDSSIAQSEQLYFRSMLTVEGENLPLARLARIRAVDEHYPLAGAVEYEPKLEYSDFQERLENNDGRFGVFFSRELTDYFNVTPNQIIKIADQEFTFRGTITSTPDFEGNNNMILPIAIISKKAMERMGAGANNLLIQHRIFANLKADLDPDIFKERAEMGFHDKGWQITTRENFAQSQSEFLGIAKRLTGLANVLVLFSFAIALFSLFKTHFIEERGSRQQLLSMGATGFQIGVSYFYRLLGLIALCLVFIFVMLILLSFPISSDALEGFFNLIPESGELPRIFLDMLIILITISVIVALTAYWTLNLSRRWFMALLALLLFVALAYYLYPLYDFDAAFLYALGAFLLALFAFWLLVKLVKSIIRISVSGRKLRHIGLLQYSGKYSTQEYFGTAIFANLVITACFALCFIAIKNYTAHLRETPKPSHYVADLQADQIANFNRTLGENGAREISHYPIVRARVTALNGEPQSENNHWFLRGDRFFGVDQDDRYALGINDDGSMEVALDQDLAEELGLQIDDHMTISLIGQQTDLVIKSIRKVDAEFGNLDFIVLLPKATLANMPHIYISSLALSEEQKPVIRKIIDKFPNAIVISTANGIARVESWASDLTSALTILGAHILGATLIALISIAFLVMRKDRYDTVIFAMMGMRKRDMRRLQLTKLLLNAFLACLAAIGIAAIFVKYGLPHLIELDLRIDLSEFMFVMVLSGLVFAAIPAILLFFNQSNTRKAEQYSQDYQKLELDF